jgi:hypothetical protein
MTATKAGVERVVDATQCAYMVDDYRPESWRRIARFLLLEGFTEHEAEAIMRSKHLRWADDSEGHGAGKEPTSAAFVRYYIACRQGGLDWRAEARDMAMGTPTELDACDCDLCK